MTRSSDFRLQTLFLPTSSESGAQVGHPYGVTPSNGVTPLIGEVALSQPRAERLDPSEPPQGNGTRNGTSHERCVETESPTDGNSFPSESGLEDTPARALPEPLNQNAPIAPISNTNGAGGNGSNRSDKNGKGPEIPDRQVSSKKEAAIEPPSPVDEAEEHGFLPVLKNFNFLALWSGQVFSQLADKVYLVLMIALIANRFQSEDQTISGWVSSIMIAFTIPAVLFGSVAGVYVDRWPKKLVLVITNLLRGGLVLFLPFGLWISQGWSPLWGLPLGFSFLLGVTFIVSTLTQFFAPAEQSVIPLLVERRHLLSANSLYTTTMMASVIVGFAVGEPLLALADHVMGLMIQGPGIGKEILVGGAYVIAGLILLLIRPHEKLDPVEFESIHVWRDIRDGIRYLQEQHRVRNALIQLVILFSIVAALAMLAVRLAEIIPGMKASQFGFLLAAGGVGLATGATVLGHFGKRLGSTSQLGVYGSVGIGASLAALALLPLNLWSVLVLLTLTGVFSALVGIPMQTTIQAETPEEMRGKVFGLQNNAVNIALTLPLALAGVAETFLGIHTVFLGLAVISIAGGLLTWYISRKK
ncbi:MAG: MFS transporter [Leptolyngbyaceae cyanobacterium bins.59]|nr:MFS transporter [Leptolyngbyaceae cyanobacterium bins.59]